MIEYTTPAVQNWKEKTYKQDEASLEGGMSEKEELIYYKLLNKGHTHNMSITILKRKRQLVIESMGTKEMQRLHELYLIEKVKEFASLTYQTFRKKIVAGMPFHEICITSFQSGRKRKLLINN